MKITASLFEAGSKCPTKCFVGLDFLDFLCSGEKDICAFGESKRRQRKGDQCHLPLHSKGDLAFHNSGSFLMNAYGHKFFMVVRKTVHFQLFYNYFGLKVTLADSDYIRETLHSLRDRYSYGL